MFRIATSVKFLEDVLIECTFNDGKIFQYDVSKMFNKFPQFSELKENRTLFHNGKLRTGGDTVYWNDELDIDCTEIYENGKLVGQLEISINKLIGIELFNARIDAWMSQKELAKISGINQADISRIESGTGNPTLKKIEKLFNALNKKIKFIVE